MKNKKTRIAILAAPAGAYGYWKMLALTLPFAAFFNVLSFFTWGYGILSFFVLLATAAWVIFAPRFFFVAGRGRPGQNRLREFTAVALSWLLIVVFLTKHVNSLVDVLQDSKSRVWPLDIGKNTYLAGAQFFFQGNNPYTEHCQIYHDVSHAPHVTTGSQGIAMYGVPYYYGYPYFPMMFAAYAPWQTIIGNYDAIRVGNAVLFLVTIPLLLLLSRRSFAKKKHWFMAGTLSVLAFCAIWQWGDQLFLFGITDIVISVLMLAGLLGLSYRKYVLTGILFGLAIGCKLLPGPLVFIFIVIWLSRQGQPVRGMITACLLTAAVIILPFFIWNPSAFFSATVLFYLTNHSMGDNTSLWYFLPSWAKTPLIILGPMLVSLCLCCALKSRDRRLWYPAKMAFVSYVLFVACSKMIHLNYLWGIFSLGAFAFAAETVEAFSAPAANTQLPTPEANPKESAQEGLHV